MSVNWSSFADGWIALDLELLVAFTTLLVNHLHFLSFLSDLVSNSFDWLASLLQDTLSRSWSWLLLVLTQSQEWILWIVIDNAHKVVQYKLRVALDLNPLTRLHRGLITLEQKLLHFLEGTNGEIWRGYSLLVGYYHILSIFELFRGAHLDQIRRVLCHGI